MQFSSICPIDRTLSGATTLDQRGPRSDTMKRYSVFPKAAALLEPHHQIVQCDNQNVRWGGGLTPQQRCSQYILRPQPTEQLSHNSYLICEDRYISYTKFD